MVIDDDSAPRVLFLSWRDASHPEGGGSEHYVHRVAEGIAAGGSDVTLLCAAHPRGAADEVRRGVRIVRRGGRLGVYLHGLLRVLTTRPDLVVEVQNGLPFGAPLVTRRPVVVLVHHVHREQWPLLFGRAAGALGWWVESRLAPLLHRRSRYVTVSESTAAELSGLGVDRARIALVHNGVEPAPAVVAARSPAPRLIALGRLVPHKRVEHAIDTLALLRAEWPELTLDVVGEGWWENRLRAHADALGVADAVTFHGFVGEERKHELLAAAWVHLCPSVKEGWGLVVMEAAGHGVPTVAYASAGGLRDSVLDGVTGDLVGDDPAAFTTAVRRLLADPARRERTGAAARARATGFSWDASARAFAAVLSGAAGRTVRAAGTPGRDSAGAVVEDGGVGAAVGENGVGGGRRHGDQHRDDAGDGAEHDGGEDAGDRLHGTSRFGWRWRRRATINAPHRSHNVTQLTTTPGTTWPATTTARRPGAGPGGADAPSITRSSSH